VFTVATPATRARVRGGADFVVVPIPKREGGWAESRHRCATVVAKRTRTEAESKAGAMIFFLCSCIVLSLISCF
jgi:hypothetical protein